MAKEWVSTSMPTQKVDYNWSIGDFENVLKFVTETGFYDSTEIKIVSHDGKMHTLKLRLEHVKHNNSDDKLNVKLVNTAANDKFYLEGTLEMDIEGTKLCGSFDNPPPNTYGGCWVFKNIKQSKVYNDDKKWVAMDFFGFSFTKKIPTLKVEVHLTTFGASNHVLKNIGTSSLMTDFTTLLNRTNEYSDFTILCEGQKFLCHETILRARSCVLDRMFQQGMQELTSRMMDVKDVSKNTIESLLEFIYTGEITKDVENDSELLYVADKYEVAGLLGLCMHRLPGVKDDMIVDMLIKADRHGFGDIKKMVMQRILMNKSRFVKDKDVMDKMKQVPHLLCELLQL